DLKFSNAIDFEAPADQGGNNVYDVTVNVSDGEVALDDTQDFVVTVTNDASDDGGLVDPNPGEVIIEEDPTTEEEAEQLPAEEVAEQPVEEVAEQPVEETLSDPVVEEEVILIA
ncbi:unnamed protein product, partial [marine sediment metagenome]